MLGASEATNFSFSKYRFDSDDSAQNEKLSFRKVMIFLYLFHNYGALVNFLNGNLQEENLAVH